MVWDPIARRQRRRCYQPAKLRYVVTAAASGWSRLSESATSDFQKARPGGRLADTWTELLQSVWWRRLALARRRRCDPSAPAAEPLSRDRSASKLSFRSLSVSHLSNFETLDPWNRRRRRGNRLVGNWIREIELMSLPRWWSTLGFKNSDLLQQSHPWWLVCLIENRSIPFELYHCWE